MVTGRFVTKMSELCKMKAKKLKQAKKEKKHKYLKIRVECGHFSRIGLSVCRVRRLFLGLSAIGK